MSLPVISIITIVFNGEKHLEQTILSVLNQSYPNVQYIIIDGGSRDNSLNIIKKYEQNLHFWISEKDKGISDAFNKGIAHATGDIIGIINADDWYEPETFSRVAEHMGDADVCFGDVQFWKDGHKEFIQKGNLELLHREITIIHPTVFVRKRMYDQYGGFDLQYRCAMDYDLLLKMKTNHARFLYIPQTLANMRWGGLSDSSWLTGCKETLAIKNKYFPSHTLRHRLYYLKHISAIQIAKTLSQLRLGFITRVYRKLLSPVKKVYNH
jgi:glycosyltransferase involved in cell wall biosynthesis